MVGGHHRFSLDLDELHAPADLAQHVDAREAPGVLERRLEDGDLLAREQCLSGADLVVGRAAGDQNAAGEHAARQFPHLEAAFRERLQKAVLDPAIGVSRLACVVELGRAGQRQQESRLAEVTRLHGHRRRPRLWRDVAAHRDDVAGVGRCNRAFALCGTALAANCPGRGARVASPAAANAGTVHPVAPWRDTFVVVTAEVRRASVILAGTRAAADFAGSTEATLRMHAMTATRTRPVSDIAGGRVPAHGL